jgi:hypothetical protein
MKKYELEEGFEAFAKIYVYIILYYNTPIITLYTKEEAQQFFAAFSNTALHWYGDSSDAEPKRHLSIKKEIKYIETEIDLAYIQKKVKGKIEVV